MIMVTTFRTLAIAAVIATCSVSAFGQSSVSLPASIVESNTLNGASLQQITGFVGSLSEAAMSEDYEDAKRAQDRLLTPLADRDISVAFRQAYADALSSMIRELQASDQVGHKLFALRLAGELSTTASIRMIREQLDADDAGTRLFAIGRARRVFEITGAHGLAVSSTEIEGLVDAVFAQGDSGENPLILDAVVRALAAGTALPGSDLAGARNQSIQSLSDLVSPILASLDGTQPPEPAYRIGLRASSALTSSVSDVNGDVTTESTSAAIRLAGNMLAVSLREIIDSNPPLGRNRDVTIRVVQSADALLYFSGLKHAELRSRPSSSVELTDFAALLREGDDRGYRNAVALLLSANSELVNTHKLDANEFIQE